MTHLPRNPSAFPVTFMASGQKSAGKRGSVRAVADLAAGKRYSFLWLCSRRCNGVGGGRLAVRVLDGSSEEKVLCRVTSHVEIEDPALRIMAQPASVRSNPQETIGK